MALNITPLHDRVLVRRLEEKETAKGGIIILRTYAAEWMSSLRNRIESNCKFGTYRASTTKLFLLQLVLFTCSDPNFDTPYLTVTRTCATRPL